MLLYFSYVCLKKVLNHCGLCRYGFINFVGKTVRNKPVVYIPQASVLHRGEGVGRRLMECVLTHYSAGTEFYILTRVFNTEAKVLYKDRLGFAEISDDEVTELGYDERYCGFKHTTTAEEIAAIKQKQYDPFSSKSSSHLM